MITSDTLRLCGCLKDCHVERTRPAYGAPRCSVVCTLSVVFFLLLLLASSLAKAQEHNIDHVPVIQRSIETVYQPRYRHFAQTTAQFVDVAQRSCQRRSEDHFFELRDRFGQLVSAFSGIELFRVGPLLRHNRLNRLFFWPDTRGAGERQLRVVMADTSVVFITAQQIAQKSVTLQGLPALERLLFGKDAKANIASDNSSPDCALLIAIAQNIDDMASAMNTEWNSRTEFVESMSRNVVNSDYFRSSDEVLRSLVTQAIVGFDIVRGRKIAPLTDEPASWKKAPLWVSGQTLPMIKSNVDSLRSLLVESGLADLAGLHDELTFEFRTANTMLQSLLELHSLTDDVGQLTGRARSLMRSLAAVTTGIALTLDDRLARNLGVSVGFNSEDGD